MATSSALQIPRIPWTPAEDEELKRAVAVHGDKRWSQIASYLPGRTSKACSHRWRTYLQPGVMHASTVPFSDWEKAVVKEAHKAVGNNWAVIARMLPGRTNAAVKNFFYSYRRRVGKTLRGHPANGSGAATAGAQPGAGGHNQLSPEDEPVTDSDDDLDSVDDMDCEDGFEDDCEHECEDEDMAGDYSYDHAHAQEGVDCSVPWQPLNNEIQGATGGGAMPPPAPWLQQQQQQGPVGRHGPPGAFSSPPMASRHPGPADWLMAEAAAREAHDSCGGSASSLQLQHDHLFQQQPLLQQHPASCFMPRRSTNHSWSGAPRCAQAAVVGAAAMNSMQSGGGLQEVVASAQAAGPMSGPRAGAPPTGGSAAAAASVMQRAPSMCGQDPFERQMLGTRQSARHISSTQLFDQPTGPFKETNSRQVTTVTNTPPAAPPPVAAAAVFQTTKSYKTGLDLSAIDESQPAVDVPEAAGSSGMGRSPAGNAAAAEAAGTTDLQRLGSECVQSSQTGGVSKGSTGEQSDWTIDPHQVKLLMDAALRCMQMQQQAGPDNEQQQQQQQQQPPPSQQQPLRHQPEQDVFRPGPPAVQHLGAQSCPIRVFPRPSLCSDAGTAGPLPVARAPGSPPFDRTPALMTALPASAGHAATATGAAARHPNGQLLLDLGHDHDQSQQQQQQPLEQHQQASNWENHSGSVQRSWYTAVPGSNKRLMLDLSDEGLAAGAAEHNN